MENTEIVQFVEQETTVAEELVVAAENLTIHNSDEADGAADWLKDIKAKFKALEDKRTAIVKPINDSVKEINALFKRPQGVLGKAEGYIKSAILKWNRVEQDRIRKEKEREEKLAESRRKRFETLAAKAEDAGNEQKAEEFRHKGESVEVEVTQEKVENPTGTFVVRRWKAEVTNLDMLIQAAAKGQVSIEALEPNLPFLNGLAKRLKGAIKIPGIKFVEEESISSRSE